MRIGKITLAAVVSLLLLLTTGALAAPDVSSERPDYVSCTYDETALQTYEPTLKTDHLDIEPSAVYGTYCESSDSDTDIAVYFAYYPLQDGFTSEDSHRLDREPVYVHVDSASGDVEKVSYSGYHYLKAVDDNPTLRNNTHPEMYVVNPHHHYVSQDLDDDVGTDVALRDLGDVHQEWYDNGWEADVEVTANPYEIDAKGSWWDNEDSRLDYRAADWYWELQLQLEELNPFSDPVTDLS